MSVKNSKQSPLVEVCSKKFDEELSEQLYIPEVLPFMKREGLIRVIMEFPKQERSKVWGIIRQREDYEEIIHALMGRFYDRNRFDSKWHEFKEQVTKHGGANLNRQFVLFETNLINIRKRKRR